MSMWKHLEGKLGTHRELLGHIIAAVLEFVLRRVERERLQHVCAGSLELAVQLQYYNQTSNMIRIRSFEVSTSGPLNYLIIK